MVFKRYIHKHGKRLGPYYYENVRSQDGKVRTIYVGTNPHYSPEPKTKKPLFLVILILFLIVILVSIFYFSQNKLTLINKPKPEEPDFSIDQILLKVLVRSGESIENQIRIMNIGTEQATINIEVQGLSDLIEIETYSFTLKPGQTKIVSLNFSSFNPKQKIEQQPGIYVGKLTFKSEKAMEEIPIIIEVESKNVLFDMNLNPTGFERNIKQGSATTFEVQLFNLGSESIKVDIEYFINDFNGNTILTESETVVAATQASFFKTIFIPKNLKPGSYIFASLARFGNSVGTSTYIFEIVGPETEESFVQFCKNNVLCLRLSLMTILLLLVLLAYFYFFIGAYLYRKVTGTVALPKRREDYAPEPKPSTLAGLKDSIDSWKKKMKEVKFKKESLKKERELQRLTEERVIRLEARNRQIEIGKKVQEELKRKEALIKEKLLEKQRAEEEKKLMKERLWKKRKKAAKEFFHRLGLFKTQEEKKQIALEKEREKEQKLRREGDLREQKEAEELKAEEERKKGEEILKKQKALEEKQRLETERKKQLELGKKAQEEAKRKEIERQKAEKERERILEAKRKFEEELRIKKEEEKRQKYLEKQNQEQIKAHKLGIIKQFEANIKNKQEIATKLNFEIRNLESQKRLLSSKINESESKIKKNQDKILNISRQIEEFNLQKKLIYDKAARHYKKMELKVRLKIKKEALMEELKNELNMLNPDKRKNVERWKRLEIKAKLKIEEQNLEEVLKKYNGKLINKDEIVEDKYKRDLEDINKKQLKLKQEIVSFENEKQQAMLEKKNNTKDLLDKDIEMQRIILKFDNITKEQEDLTSELSKLKSELSKLGWGILSILIQSYKTKIQKTKKHEEYQTFTQTKKEFDEERKKQGETEFEVMNQGLLESIMKKRPHYLNEKIYKDITMLNDYGYEKDKIKKILINKGYDIIDIDYAIEAFVKRKKTWHK